MTTVARVTDDKLMEITVHTKAMDGYGMISEAPEDSTSEAQELPGICKRNLGRQVCNQRNSNSKAHLQAQFLHRDNITWSALVNIGQHWCTVPSESPAKNCRLVAFGAQAKLARIRHESPGEHHHDHPTSTLHIHAISCHHLQTDQTHSQSFQDSSMPEYARVCQHIPSTPTQHRHLQRDSCFVQLADLLRQPATCQDAAVAEHGRAMWGWWRW